MRVVHVGNYVTESSIGVDKTVAGFMSWLPRYGVEVEAWHFTRWCIKLMWDDMVKG